MDEINHTKRIILGMEHRRSTNLNKPNPHGFLEHLESCLGEQRKEKEKLENLRSAKEKERSNLISQGERQNLDGCRCRGGLCDSSENTITFKRVVGRTRFCVHVFPNR